MGRSTLVTPARTRSLTMLLLALSLAAGALMGRATPSRAQDFEHIDSYDVHIQVQPDGSLLVVERIAYDFADEPHHGIYRDIPVRYHYDSKFDRVYRLHVESVVGSPGTPDGYKTQGVGPTSGSRSATPRRPSPDATTTPSPIGWKAP